MLMKDGKFGFIVNVVIVVVINTIETIFEN